MALYGPSGCGKSTLLLMVGGLLSPDAGTVEIAGTNPYALNADRRAGFRAEHLGQQFAATVDHGRVLREIGRGVDQAHDLDHSFHPVERPEGRLQ